MRFHWWDDARDTARWYAQWTGLRHSVRGERVDGLWLWRVEAGEPLGTALEILEPLGPLLEVCS